MGVAGVDVKVVQEPWGTFGDRFFTEMAAGGDAWDMVIGDSQWLGQSTTANYYVDMTEFLTSTGIKDTVTPATLTYYGEYPAGSGTYWAYPTEGDANGWAYRKDLFEAAGLQAAGEVEKAGLVRDTEERTSHGRVTLVLGENHWRKRETVRRKTARQPLTLGDTGRYHPCCGSPRGDAEGRDRAAFFRGSGARPGVWSRM